jgi:dTDP-4-dehydrorhamnose 3,5-epimerase
MRRARSRTGSVVPMPNQPFSVEPTEIAGLFVVQMKQFEDERGTVREFYRESDFLAAGLPSLGNTVQINLTASHQGVIRGLHGEAMQKFVAVAGGEAFGAYLDPRPTSPSRGKVVTVALRPGMGVLVENGLCNGFQAVAPGVTEYLYCFDEEWAPGMAGVSVSPFDPDLAIPWPIAIETTNRALVSAKDAAAPHLHDLGLA